MLEFVSSNWLWILLIGGMVFMHVGHSRRHGGHMAHGGHRHPGGAHGHVDDLTGADRGTDEHRHSRPGCH